MSNIIPIERIARAVASTETDTENSEYMFKYVVEIGQRGRDVRNVSYVNCLRDAEHDLIFDIDCLVEKLPNISAGKVQKLTNMVETLKIVNDELYDMI